MGNNRLIFHKDPQVTGVNRYKYFRRPIIPYVESMGGQVVYLKNKDDSNNKYKNKDDDVNNTNDSDQENNIPKSRTIGIQTLYRYNLIITIYI